MTHLPPDTFVDLLDGTLAEAAVPHLASCDACRQQLAELRATWQTAVDVEVPEPSPLFWDHLSARVRDAVAADVQPRAPWWRIDWSWTSISLAGAAVAALVLVSVLQVTRTVAPRAGAATASGAAAVAGIAAPEPLKPLADDESIGLMADLASAMDWDSVAELGLAPVGGAERAASEMTAGERVELQRLLHEALGPSADQS